MVSGPLAEPVRIKEKEKENGDGVEACRLRRTHRRRLLAATATGREGRGCGEARGGEVSAVGVLTGGEEASSGGGVGDRGGRGAVGDEHDDARHHSPWRGRQLHRGALGVYG